MPAPKAGPTRRPVSQTPASRLHLRRPPRRVVVPDPVRKRQIRTTKSQIRNKSKTPTTNTKTLTPVGGPGLSFGFLTLEFVSKFGFRISCLPPSRHSLPTPQRPLGDKTGQDQQEGRRQHARQIPQRPDPRLHHRDILMRQAAGENVQPVGLDDPAPRGAGALLQT